MRLLDRGPDDPAAGQMTKATQTFMRCGWRKRSFMRQAHESCYRVMGTVKADLEEQGGGNSLVKLLASKAVRDQLSRCSQDLQKAHQGFHVSFMLILCALTTSDGR